MDSDNWYYVITTKNVDGYMYAYNLGYAVKLWSGGTAHIEAPDYKEFRKLLFYFMDNGITFTWDTMKVL